MERVNNLATTFKIAWNLGGSALEYMMSNVRVDNLEKGLSLLLEDKIISSIETTSDLNDALSELKNGHVIVAVSGKNILSVAKSRNGNVFVSKGSEGLLASTIQFEREAKGVKKFYILKK